MDRLSSRKGLVWQDDRPIIIGATIFYFQSCMFFARFRRDRTMIAMASLKINLYLMITDIKHRFTELHGKKLNRYIR